MWKLTNSRNTESSSNVPRIILKRERERERIREVKWFWIPCSVASLAGAWNYYVYGSSRPFLKLIEKKCFIFPTKYVAFFLDVSPNLSTVAFTIPNIENYTKPLDRSIELALGACVKSCHVTVNPVNPNLAFAVCLCQINASVSKTSRLIKEAGSALIPPPLAC